MRRNAQLIFWLVIVFTALTVVFIFPQLAGNKFRPWRLGLDLVGGTHLEYEVDLSKIQESDRDSVLNGLRDVIERRVNLFGVSEPQVYTTQAGGKTGLVVELAGIKNVSDAIKAIGETPLLDFREVRQNGSGTPEYIPTDLTGRYITGAQLTFDNNTQQPQVSLSFNSDGAKLFEDITGRNVGKPLAIFLDNQLIEQPVVQQRIPNGQAVITGKFTIDTARQLVERFNAGALPAPITLVNQQTVSATLGADLLRKAIVAGIAGTLLVMAFMVSYYGVLGTIAVLALLVYAPVTLAVFKFIPVTMTLAGLAGFILTIGMAVDANILIFERMKEETEKGITRRAAIDEGFRRAWPSIRDSNVSTMITAAILYYFTTSFIKGFALTLFLGVAVSMFSALFVTWTFLRVLLKRT